MKPTLELLKERQAELAAMIAAFEAQAETAYIFPETEIALRPGESYAGLIIGKDASPSYHLILMAGEAEMPWKDAREWAKELGGDLPTRREQALLFANCKEHIQEAWYWSCEEFATKGYAWCQYFTSGNQNHDYTITTLRARAVRRLVIQ